jgi:hypothetical protein
MTTTTAAAGNGSTDDATTTTGKPERLTGMAQVREAEAYHTASVMHDAIFEADRLCSAIYRVVTDAYLTRFREDQADPDAPSAAEMASSPEVRDQAAEALRCLYSAQGYLQQLSGYEPPF